MKQYKRLTTKCEVGVGLTETDGNIVNDYEKVVNRLAKLEDKLENGTLKELPCKIGDTIYYANIFAPTPKIEEYVVTVINIFANELLHKISTQIECYPVKDGPCSFGKYTFNDRDIFTSRAKAKQEMEKLMNE